MVELLGVLCICDVKHKYICVYGVCVCIVCLCVWIWCICVCMSYVIVHYPITVILHSYLNFYTVFYILHWIVLFYNYLDY